MASENPKVLIAKRHTKVGRKKIVKSSHNKVRTRLTDFSLKEVIEMIPAPTTRMSLETLLQQLRKEQSEEEKNLQVQDIDLDERFDVFCDLLTSASEDLSVIMSLVERDPDCRDSNGYRRLCALIEYVEITCAVYGIKENYLPPVTEH